MKADEKISVLYGKSPLLLKEGCGNCIVDFICSSEKLIIELDGDSHGDYFRISEDIKRDEYLQDLGYIVMRFENRFVFQDPDFVMNEIRLKFNQPPRPSGTPP